MQCREPKRSAKGSNLNKEELCPSRSYYSMDGLRLLLRHLEEESSRLQTPHLQTHHLQTPHLQTHHLCSQEPCDKSIIDYYALYYETATQMSKLDKHIKTVCGAGAVLCYFSRSHSKGGAPTSAAPIENITKLINFRYCF